MIKTLWAIGASTIYGLTTGLSVPSIVAWCALHFGMSSSSYQLLLLWLSPVLLLMPLFYFYGQIYRFIFLGHTSYNLLLLATFLTSTLCVGYIIFSAGAGEGVFSLFLRCFFAMLFFFVPSVQASVGTMK